MRGKQTAGKTPVVVVVVIAAVVMFVCTGLGVGLILPALKLSREAAQRRVSINNLKQIGLALHMYHDVNGSFPPAVMQLENGQQVSWRTLLRSSMSFNGTGDLDYDFDRSWVDPQNQAAAEKKSDMFASPFVYDDGLTSYVAIAGPSTALTTEGAVKLDDITDGPSNTVMVIEDVGNPVPWTSPQDITPEELLRRYEEEDFPSRSLLLLMGDGSVQEIDYGNPATLRGLIDRKDGK